MGKMEPQGEMGFFPDQFETNNMMGAENSESENYDTVSVEDHVDGGSQSTTVSATTRKPRRKRYHRHTPQQIQELEHFFKGVAHPDEKQRLELGKRLGLEGRQVKFWFQNRRTQMKTQIERHENVSLKQEYDKLRLENSALKEAMRNPTCQDCGGAVTMGEISMHDHELKLENERLKDELIRVTAMAEKFLGRPVSDLAHQIMAASGAPSSGLMGLNNLPIGVSSNTSMNGSIMASDYEKTVYMQVAMTAMDELLTMAQADSPFWFKSLEDGRDLFNEDEYAKKFSSFVGMKPFGFITDATKEASTVFISSFELVETMMCPRRFKDTFPCMLGKADAVEVLCNGNGGSRDGELHLMNAEFVYPSPFVPLRQEKLIRFAKQHSPGMWAVVDVSVDMIRGSSGSGSSVKWRRLPSGFVVQDVANGYSLVTWVEHVEYDENAVHQLYRPFLRSGTAFGAQRWLASLQRERECVAVFMSPKIYPDEDAVIEATSPEGKRSIVKLMKRISNNFCSGLCASSSRRWEKLEIGGLSADVSIMSRICVNEPGEPSGVVLSASTSVWLPVPRQHLFDFLRDEKVRGKWDILANGGPMKVIACFPKSQNKANCISLFCPPAAPPRESNMLILQESWSDRTGSFVVYAPVDTTLVESVLRGEDSDYVALLPSGFAICDGPLPSAPTGASILTMGFQILVNSLPTAKLTVESIETVSTLMSCTIQKIRGAVGVNY